MLTSDFDYELPPERIAQTPLPRGESRLMVLHRKERRIEHRMFTDLLEYLHPDDTLTLNDTRVSARRLKAYREGGEEAEVFLMRPDGERGWEAMVRPGRALRPGKVLTLVDPTSGKSVSANVVRSLPSGTRILELESAETRDALMDWGETPLPPYIETPLPKEEAERYQTVYARANGSAAAPTAGLHFSEKMLMELSFKGVSLAKLTLHVGIDTFRPVRTEAIDQHEMHGEIAALSPEAAEIINRTKGRVVAVGTTCVRTLETAAKEAERLSLHEQRVAPFTGETRLYITPGYRYRAVDAMITNFHLPRSTLLMLVSAFADHSFVMEAYRTAVTEKYRFFSFGDAMLII